MSHGSIGAVISILAATFIWHSANASPVMPSLATVPTGWTTDRYDPASFTDVGTYQGHTNVLGIGIDSSTDLANRPGGFSNSFYNTQGRGHVISGGAGSVLSADLFINGSWGNSGNGFVRTDIWGVMTDALNNVSDYTIIGFTNYGGAARLRVWDDDLNSGNGDWVNLAMAVNFDAWTTFDIDFTGNAFDYYVNGTLAYHDTTINTTTQFSSVLMQAYNFADPALGNPTPTTMPYVAHWSNVDALAGTVPEPNSILLAALALLSLSVVRRGKRS